MFLVGTDIYETLIKQYTEKQWGRSARKLPSFIIRRLPLRFTYDNNYFNDRFQGIPIGGYTKMFEKMLDGIEVRINTDYLQDKEYFDSIANKVIFTGPIDEYFDYSLGELDYRSLGLKRNVLEKKTIKEMLSLIIVITQENTLVLLSTSTLKRWIQITLSSLRSIHRSIGEV